MKQAYEIPRYICADKEIVLARVDAIIRKYVADGYRLTVRQIYYQMVARDWFPNEMRWAWNGAKWVRNEQGTINAEPNYKWLCGVINLGRMAGILDWDAIEDRTREFITRSRWNSPAEVVQSAHDSYHKNQWDNQSERVFVIIEKDALAGVIEGTCYKYDVPLLAARGYPSSSVLREFALNDLVPTIDNGQVAQVIHLGDHDPSGIDMTRDLEERLRLFSGTSEEDDGNLFFTRIALNWKQVQEVKPPPNPAKTDDPRFKSYKAEFGLESWELDALSPEYINALLSREIEAFIDETNWEAKKDEIETERAKIGKAVKYIKRLTRKD